MVAGGIGVTPYLAFLGALKKCLKDPNARRFVRRVDLIWICRDKGLIDYVTSNYLSLEETEDDKVQFRIIIYNTENEKKKKSDKVDELEPLLLPVCSDKEDQLTDNVTDISAPMIPSRTSSKSTVLGNLTTTAVFSSVVWPGAFFVWFVYTFFQKKHIMSTRLW
eukprot:CAMPEP_0171298990 /NCGR_PEP_ID=MMETSP0816-20121228/7778_1 /TAXON_ID=420281 /ORGANISM="Proboscia inermis, Strain CCAP1064/1" /LENGTH=163 /DNA_ID=CAMNT_0011774427 /DNA_START=734 /DNA_END=1222 /DNA_ORIENTATION=-